MFGALCSLVPPIKGCFLHWYVFLWACLCRHHTKTVLMSHEWLSASPLFAQISFQSGQQHVLARSSLSTAWCKLEEARTLHRNVNRNVTLNLFTDTHDFMKRLVNKGQWLHGSPDPSPSLGPGSSLLCAFLSEFWDCASSLVEQVQLSCEQQDFHVHGP